MTCGYLGKHHANHVGLTLHHCNRFNRTCSLEPNTRIVDEAGTRMLSCAVQPDGTRCKSFIEGPLPPAVDVIVTSHNYGRFLDECLDSVEATGQLIVVDDASDADDQTKAICERRGVRYLRVEHRSLHKSLAAGFALCASPLVCFLDADNTHQPGYLDQAARLFAQNPRLAIVYPDMQFFGDRSELVPVPPFDRDRIEHANSIDTGSVWLREALLQARIFPL